MGDDNATPPGYATSVQAAFGFSRERAEELNRWLFETVLPNCSLKTDVLDMINAGRGIADLTQTEKLFLAYLFGRVAQSAVPGGALVVFGRREP
jgi:hypothetical protein